MSLQKKLQEAEKRGFSAGVNWACDWFDRALENTKGIGFKTREKIMEQVREEARKGDDSNAQVAREDTRK